MSGEKYQKTFYLILKKVALLASASISAETEAVLYSTLARITSTRDDIRLPSGWYCVCPSSCSVCMTHVRVSEVFFKIKIYYFLDTLILLIFFLIIKIIIFRGDLSDISAKTATLVRVSSSAFVYAEVSASSP